VTLPPRDLTCTAAVGQVTDLIEDGLGEEHQVDLELHMVTCVGCTAVVQQTRTTIQLLGALPRQSLTEAALDNLLAGVRPRLAQWRREAGSPETGRG
jgi:hypothetical protein